MSEDLGDCFGVNEGGAMIKRIILLVFFGLVGVPVWALDLEVRPGDKPDTYIVAVKNTAPDFLHVVGRKTRSQSFVAMSFTLRGKYLSSRQGDSEKSAPYLVIESRVASGEQVLSIHPPELAGSSLFDASYEDSVFIFSPGQEYLCTIHLPSPPTQVNVRWVGARERNRVSLARWRAVIGKPGA